MRRIPEDNLAYPVLISLGQSIGSGFFLNTGDASYLVTASHVLFDKQTQKPLATKVTLTSYPKENTNHEKTVQELDLTSMIAAGEIKIDFSRDIAVVRIGIKSPTDDELFLPAGLTVVSLASKGIICVPLSGVKKFNDVTISNDIIIFGYPVSLGLPHIPQLDYSHPLLRTGIVAGKNDMLGSIILDCPVYPGNSGGPVLEVEQVGLNYHYRVIGVVIEFVPTTAIVLGTPSTSAVVNSGYSVAAAMDGVLTLVGQFPDPFKSTQPAP